MRYFDCKVTNLEAEQPVERLGYVFQPGEVRTIRVRETSFREIDGAASLTVEIAETHAPPEPSRPEDLKAEYERVEELESQLQDTQAEQKRLSDELAASRERLAEARVTDEQKKRDAASEGKRPSQVKATASKLENEVEDLAYSHWAASIKACELRRDLHRTREPIAQAEHLAAQEAADQARADLEAAEVALREARNKADGLTKKPGECQRKARDAEVQRRDLEVSGPSGS